MNTYELADELGITPRQLDHWCRRGLVPGQDKRPGSGHHREFDNDQQEHLRQMSSLVRNGFLPAKASELVENGQARRILSSLEPQ